MAPFIDKYFTVTSNGEISNRIYPDNKVSKFRAVLPKPIELDTSTDGSHNKMYEMGLKEIQVPNSFYNVYKQECYMDVVVDFPHLMGGNDTMSEETNTTVLTLPEGFYTDVNHILHQLNDINLVLQNVTFKYNPNTGRVEVTQVPGGIRVNLSPPLRALLGFKTEGETYIHPGPAPNTVNLFANIPRQLFVHCDVLEPQLIGDTKRRVLRTVGIDSVKRFGSLLVKTYDVPDYVPILQPHFHTIEFSIRTDDGRKAPFQFGPSLVKVHIRRARR
jgi:hypothetical protein